MRLIPRALFLIQLVFAIRVVLRLARTANGSRISVTADRETGELVTVLVPIVNEVDRLGPCLDGLIAQGPDVAEIVVVDGGSTDGSTDLVLHFAAIDDRIRLVDATPVPASINGKAHNLRVGYEHALPDTAWVLTVDADVRLRPGLVTALLAHAARENVHVLSAATRQRIADRADGLIHPAMLTTLVYRFGIPGHATSDPRAVQANGQCMLLRRVTLERNGGFNRVLDTLCEDVTLARSLTVSGERVGFYEAGELIEVEMYASWRETWTNWARSLPMRDRYVDRAAAIGLAEVTLVQALPLWLGHLARVRLGPRHPLTLLNIGLVMLRFGVLAGTRRAYVEPPLSYWLSPLCDLPVTIRLWLMSARRRHVWRGRVIERGGT